MDKERYLADLAKEFYTEKLRHMYLLDEAATSLKKMKEIIEELEDFE